MDLRTVALYVARMRVGLGMIMVASPKLAFGSIFGAGVNEPGPAAVGRMMGAREAALGAGAAIAVGERRGSANWVSMIAIADAADCLVTLGSPRLGWRGRALGILAGGSSVAHFLLAQRLARDIDAAN